MRLIREVSKHELPSYHVGNRTIFIAFLFYVVYWYLQGGQRFPILGAIRFEFFAGLMLGAFAIHDYLANPHRTRSGIGRWVVFLLATFVIMTIFSAVPAFSFDILIDRIFKFALFGFMICAFVTTPKRLALFVGAFLLAGLKMGQEGLLGNITGSLIWENQGVLRLHGSTPNYMHPNSFAGMALGCVPFLLHFFPVASVPLRLVLLVHLGLMLHIVVFTGSRTGYLGFLGMVIFLVWQTKHRVRLLFVLGLVVVVVGPMIPSQYFERAETLSVEQEGEQGGIAKREEIFRDAWQVFTGNPMGIGVSAFPAVRKARFGRSQDTHSLYLEIATNLGVPGLVAFSGYIITLLRLLLKISRSTSQQIDELRQRLAGRPKSRESFGGVDAHLLDLRIIFAASGAVFLFLITRLMLGVLGHDLYEIYWWFALGITLAMWNMSSVARQRTQQLTRSLDTVLDPS